MPKVRLRPLDNQELLSHNALPDDARPKVSVAITFHMTLSADTALHPVVAESFVAKRCSDKSRTVGLLQVQIYNLTIRLLIEAATGRALQSLLSQIIRLSSAEIKFNYYGLLYIPLCADISFAATYGGEMAPALVDVVRFDQYSYGDVRIDIDFFARRLWHLNQCWLRYIDQVGAYTPATELSLPVFHLGAMRLPSLRSLKNLTKFDSHAEKLIDKLQRLAFMLSGTFSVLGFSVVLGSIAFFVFGIVLLSRIGHAARLVVRSCVHKSANGARHQSLQQFYRIGLSGEISCKFGLATFCKTLTYRTLYIFMYSSVLNYILYPFAYLLIGFSYAKGLEMLIGDFGTTCATAVAFMLSRYVLYLLDRSSCINPKHWLKLFLQITGVITFAGSTVATYTIGSFSSINYLEWLLQNHTGGWCNRTNPFVNNSNPWTVNITQVLSPNFIPEIDQSEYFAGLSLMALSIVLQFSIFKNRNLPNQTDRLSSARNFPVLVSRCGKLTGMMMLLPDLAVHGVVYGLNTIFMLTSLAKIINTYISSDIFTVYMLSLIIPILAPLIAAVNFITWQNASWRPEKNDWRKSFGNLGFRASEDTKAHVLAVAAGLYVESKLGGANNYMAQAQDLYNWFSGTDPARQAVLRILHQYSVYYSNPGKLGDLLSILQIKHNLSARELDAFHKLCRVPKVDRARRAEADTYGGSHREALLGRPFAHDGGAEDSNNTRQQRCCSIM
jgi:hypothetical protein